MTGLHALLRDDHRPEWALRYAEKGHARLVNSDAVGGNENHKEPYGPFGREKRLIL
jgi:hypothetical protein